MEFLTICGDDTLIQIPEQFYEVTVFLIDQVQSDSRTVQESKG